MLSVHFPCSFLGRPRGRGASSKSMRRASASTQRSVPKGRPVVTARRTAANSFSVSGVGTPCRQRLCRAASDLSSRSQAGGFGQRVEKRLEVAGGGADRVAVVAAIEGMIDQAIGDRAGEPSPGASLD